MRKTNKILLMSIIAVAIVVLSSCGSLLPNHADIVVKNDTENSYSTNGTTIDVEIEFKNAFIDGAGIETDKATIKEGKYAVYHLFWYGERSDFKFKTDYIYSTTISGSTTDNEFKDTTFARILDVGNGDTILIKLTTNNGMPEVEVSKDYTITGSESDTQIYSSKQE